MNILCIANFRANTGYAWDHINAVYAALAERTAAIVWVAYASLDGEPRLLRDSRCRWVELDVQMRDLSSLLRTARFIRQHRISTLYLTDRRSIDPAYALLRLVGIRRIVVHQRRGAGVASGRAKRLAARLVPGAFADAVVCVSDFVADRQRSQGVPADRVHRVWNALMQPVDPLDIRRTLGIAAGRPVIGIACRADPGKGIDVLLRAFDRLEQDAALVYFGDGQSMADIRDVHSRMLRGRDVILAGYHVDARRLLASADIAVVPSTHVEAFGMAALEPMAAGVPVVASQIGGLPEVVTPDTGILVPPGDVDRLRAALDHLIACPDARQRMGECGRVRARTLFGRNQAVDEIARLLLQDGTPVASVSGRTIDTRP